MALTDLTRISTSGIATGSTIDAPILRKDVSFHGSQVGVTSALFDSSDDALEFNDNVKLKFGNDGDLEVYHDGDSYIDVKTGSLYFRNTFPTNTIFQTGNFTIKNQSNNQTVAIFAPGANGGGKLYHENDLKFQTTQTGAVVTGILTATSFSGPVVGNTNNTSGISTFYDLRVSNNLTVEGTTTTLDTNLIGVDRVNIGADSNTDTAIVGIQSGTADIVNLFDGTTEVLTVKDGGFVGVGTINPGRQLHVLGTTRPLEVGSTNLSNIIKLYNSGTGRATYNGFDIKTSSTSGGGLVFYGGYLDFATSASNGTDGTSRIRILSDGKVGIGTDNPATDLEVHGDSGGTIRLAKGGTNRTTVLAGDTLGKIEFRSYDASLNHTSFNGTYAQIETVAVDDLGGVPGENVRLDFKIADSDEPGSGKVITPVSALSILQGGKIGIGTNNPSRELTLYSPDSGSTFVNFTNATTGTTTSDGFDVGLSGNEEAKMWNHENTDMQFATNNTMHMNLRETGQLGIGTDFVPGTTAKKLTLICDSVGDGIWIGNKENLYSAASTGYSDIRFTFYDYLTGGYTAGGEVNIRARSRNAYASSRTTDLDFMVSPPGGTGIGVTAVRIQSGAKLGIGMNSDQKSSLKGKLDIDGSAEYLTSSTVGVNTSSNYAIVIRNPSTTNTANGIAWTNDSGANVGGAIIHIDKGSNNIGDLAFYTAASSNTPTEKLRITSAGLVGIGIDDPNQKLHIRQDAGGAVYPILLQNRTNADSSVGIQFIATGSDLSDGQYASIESQGPTAGNTKHDLLFKTVTNGGTPTEKLRIKSTGEVHISDRNSSNTGEHFFQAGAFGIRMEDTGGYNRWNIERNYGGYKSTPVIHLSTQGRVGINTFAPVSTLDVISTEGLGSIIQRDFQGTTNTTNASSKLALTIWGKNHYDSAYGSTGTDAYGPMIGFGGRVDNSAPNTGDIRAGISYKYNGDLTFHAEAGGNVTDGTNERFRIDGTNGHIITNGGVREFRGGRQYTITSTSDWTTLFTFSNANNNGFSMECGVSENNYTTMYRVAGTAKWNSVYFTADDAGDSAHAHSSDITFQLLNDSGTKRLQAKAVSYTTTRYLTVISIWCKSGYVTWS